MISVIIATWNGASTLPRTLDALAGLAVPDNGWELIVVDNASDDMTPQIIAEAADRLPLTALHEPRRGKAHALDTGIAAAQGDLVVFTDDDILPDPGWLRAYERGARDHPDFDCFIGEIRHDWPWPPADWLKRLCDAGLIYGGTPPGRAAGPVSYMAVRGANMAVRRNALEGVGNRTEAEFNYMGKGTGTGGVDTFLIYDVVGGSEDRVWYLENARVRHIIRENEMCLRTVFDRTVRIGKTNYFADTGAQELFASRVMGIPIQVVGRMARFAASGLYHLVIRRDSEAAARRMLDYARDRGRWISWRGDR